MDAAQADGIGAGPAAADLATSSAHTESGQSISRVRQAHPLQERENLLSCVRFFDVSNLGCLASPLPRAQDLPAESFRTPCSGDQVVSVSHAWRNQAHPDPTCQKMKLLSRFLSKLSTGGGGAGIGQQSLLLFLDFISIPQRPFRADQQPRTEEEAITFKNALKVMHEVYFYSDRIIHLPWESVDAEVPGEGVEQTVIPNELRDCTFAKVGDCVQIASLPARPAVSTSLWGRSIRPQAARGCRLFDRVVSVDGHPITSIEQLESILAQNPRNVRLRHYPFGNYSEIHADVRGWVFLERFITMVKCAMMDEETAKNVVITPSEAIFKQIMSGASRLREASVQEAQHHKHGELKQALDGFREELQGKQFSPASTDKRELTSPSSLVDDREVVSSIMHHFVEHLAEHWEAEAAKQRSFAHRLSAVVALAETYLLEWDCFSDDYAAKLAAASTANPWPVVVLATVPVALTLTFLVYPYPSPDQGWTAQIPFWAWGFPFMEAITFSAFPVFLAKVTNFEPTRTSLVVSTLWALGCPVLVVGVSISIASAIDAFPVPMLHFVGVGIVISLMHLLWWCIPKELRDSSEFRARLYYAMLAMNSVVGLFGTAVPFVNAALSVVSMGWQFLLVTLYLVSKLAFEIIGVTLSKRLGADVMPYFVFWASIAYQVNLCVAFSKVSSWLVVLEQMCFDVLENSYHLYSIFRLDPLEEAAARREQYIVASLVLREFVELVVPASFLLMSAALQASAPEESTLLCNREADEVRQTERFLQADLAVEFLGSCVTYLILLRRNHAPLLLLRGVIATRLFALVTIAACNFAFYCSMQHTHWGFDLSFRFRWLVDRESTWECGLTWASPPAQ